MMSPAPRAELRRLFDAAPWRVGSIATVLGRHHATVRRAFEAERFLRTDAQIRPSALDPGS